MSEPNDVYVDYAKMKAERDALAAQRDEGLAREAELMSALADALVVVSNHNTSNWTAQLKERIKKCLFLASPGCADGEKAE